MLIDALPIEVVAAPLGLSCVAIVALVWCDWNGFKTGRYLFKPLAAAAFVWLAVALNAGATVYGTWLLAALVLCMLGDLLLMPDSERFFLAGLTAFLCGHLLFAVAFLQLPTNGIGLLASALPVAILLVFVGRWLTPHLPAQMKIPVALYILVICSMLLCAGLTVEHEAAPLILAGAWGFAASDLAVARKQFVDPSRLNGLWGTPLYFLSQMVLAATVAFV